MMKISEKEEVTGVAAEAAALAPSGLSPCGSQAKPPAANAGCRPADFTDDYRASVCKIGQGAECCRYLTMSGSGWGCEKRTSMRYAIDLRAETMRAKGDNCEGMFAIQPAFRLTADRFEHKAGTIIYPASGYDYGCASDDAAVTGKPHTSMTLEPSGDYPFFTVPNEDFAPLSVQS